MFQKIIQVLLITVVVFGFAVFAQAQEATTTPETTSTTTPEVLPEVQPEPPPPEPVATSTAPVAEPAPEPAPISTTTPATTETTATSTPAEQEPVYEPKAQPIEPVAPISAQPAESPADNQAGKQEQQLIPDPPKVEPVVPFNSANGKGFDPYIAPSIVKIKIVDPKNEIPKSPVFITFVGVGGKTFGGQINRYGELEVVMPTGRYYADILVIDTQLGPPLQPPAFFLEANEKRDLGVFTLSEKSLFADEALEREMAHTIGKGDVSGFAKVFALVVKLLLSILQELRSIRSELLWR